MDRTERAAKDQYERYRLGLADRERIKRLGLLEAGITEDEEDACKHTPTLEEIAEACKAFRRGQVVKPVDIPEIGVGQFRRRANQGGV